MESRQLSGEHQARGDVAELAVAGLARLDQHAERTIRADRVSFDEDAFSLPDDRARAETLFQLLDLSR